MSQISACAYGGGLVGCGVVGGLVGGFVYGWLISVLLIDNVKVQRWERAVWLVSAGALVVLTVTGIAINSICDCYPDRR